MLHVPVWHKYKSPMAFWELFFQKVYSALLQMVWSTSIISGTCGMILPPGLPMKWVASFTNTLVTPQDLRDHGVQEGALLIQCGSIVESYLFQPPSQLTSFQVTWNMAWGCISKGMMCYFLICHWGTRYKNLCLLWTGFLEFYGSRNP